MYKMVNIDKETYGNNNIEAIADGIGKLWLNEKHIEEKLGHKHLPVITNKYDIYFHKHEFAIEVDELGHADKNLSNEIERQKAREKELNCVFIRYNPDEKKFKIFKEINKIHRHIKKSTKKLLIDDLSKRLLELEFKSNHSIKSKCLKWIVKKILPDYKE